MPPQPSPAPAQNLSLTQADDAHFPQGQCRYILMQQEVKGHRCACANFSRNRALPGAVCDCGHQACFHLASFDAPSPGQNRDEIQTLKQRLGVLEAQHRHPAPTSSEQGDSSSIVLRLSQLEDTLDKNREDLHSEIKASYRNIAAAWQTIEQLQSQLRSFESTHRIQSEQLARAGKELQDLRNRNLELLETDEMLEERIEKLEGEAVAQGEGMEALLSPAHEPSDKALANDVSPMPILASRVPRQHRYSEAARSTQSPSRITCAQPATPRETPKIHPAGSHSSPWTVHVSMLPSREQPFPFEKDTNAYKRCLSRGLQRMVAVQGHTGTDFVAAVSRAFRDVLRGAPWTPLQAEVCDAKDLQGQPMLRPHQDILEPMDWGIDFLRKQCAVCDAEGRIQSLYLALRHENLSWVTIKSFPVFVEGLESCWEHDPHLDGSSVEAAEQPHPAASSTRCYQESFLTSGYPKKRRASDLDVSLIGIATSSQFSSETGEMQSPLKRSRTSVQGMIEIR